MDQPPDRIGVPFEPATEPARLRKVSRPILRLIFDGTIGGRPPNRGRSFAIGYILRHLGQRSNGSSSANYPPSRD
jgi:hypothetical protein